MLFVLEKFSSKVEVGFDIAKSGQKVYGQVRICMDKSV